MQRKKFGFTVALLLTLVLFTSNVLAFGETHMHNINCKHDNVRIDFLSDDMTETEKEKAYIEACEFIEFLKNNAVDNYQNISHHDCDNRCEHETRSIDHIGLNIEFINNGLTENEKEKAILDAVNFVEWYKNASNDIEIMSSCLIGSSPLYVLSTCMSHGIAPNPCYVETFAVYRCLVHSNCNVFQFRSGTWTSIFH